MTEHESAPLRHLSVNQVHELIALYKADRVEYRAIEAKLGFKGPPTHDDFGVLDVVEFDRRSKLIEAYGRPAHLAYATAVHAISAEAMIELIALGRLGRGDHDDFEVIWADQRERFSSGERSASYVLNKAAFPLQYWPAGLARLGLS